MPSFSLDPVLDALSYQLDQCEGRALWLAEEQVSSEALPQVLVRRGAVYLSNRFDQFDTLRAAGAKAEFHDFERAQLEGRQFEHIFIRVPKQRALAHHLLNLMPNLLASEGKLWIAGLKGEGIKTHVMRAESRLGSKAQKLRAGRGVGLYLLELGAPGAQLEDEDYAELRQLQFGAGLHLWTKPGIYGWNKVDRGSALLVEVMHQLYANLEGKAVLDLGCGYGYLAIQAAAMSPVHLVATDNNAAAVRAAHANLKAGPIDAQALASDCGGSISEKFDLVLCNPPFHQGFAVNQSLHQKFLAAIARLLKPGGRALVVVNSFLRLDNLCRDCKLDILQSWPFEDEGFKVVCLAKAGEQGV